MVSENLLAMNYVKEVEIRNAIDRYDQNNHSIRIVPILLVPYDFLRSPPYNLGRFTALPFMLKPVITFRHQHEAWYTVAAAIKVMIERDYDPGLDGEVWSKEIRKIYEDISFEGQSGEG